MTRNRTTSPPICLQTVGTGPRPASRYASMDIARIVSTHVVHARLLFIYTLYPPTQQFFLFVCVLLFPSSFSLLPLPLLVQRQVTVEGCDTFETTSYLEREPARLRLHWLNATRPDEESKKEGDASVDCTDAAAASEQSQTSPMVARLWSLLSADSYKVALAFVGTSLHVTVYVCVLQCMQLGLNTAVHIGK